MLQDPAYGLTGFRLDPSPIIALALRLRIQMSETI